MSAFLPTLSLLEKLVPELFISIKPRLNLTAPDKTSQLRKQCFDLLETALRRWVILRSLYDENSDYYYIPSEVVFKCADWQKFIAQEFPDLKNKTCYDLILDSYSEIDIENLFSSPLQAQYQLPHQEFDTFFKKSPFYIIQDRTIRNYFNELSKLTPFPILEKPSDGHGQYRKVEDSLIENFLNYTPEKSLSISSNNSLIEFNFINEEMSSIVELLFFKIKDQQRLFLHDDYIVHEDLRDHTDDNAACLKEIWKVSPNLPIKINYYSASLHQVKTYIIYPVCIHYYRRAYYLSAWGEYPYQNDLIPLQWYNFRLERVQKIQQLSWDYPQLSFSLQDIEDKKINVNYIQTEFEKAYGFDFYQPPKIALLKFDPNFAQRYIDNSFRHHTFEKIDDIEEILSFIETETEVNTEENISEQNQIIDKVKQASNHIYYLFTYRQNDNNVIMQLRSWSPNVEVLLPLDLRQRMREDMEKTYQFYQDSF